MSAMVEMPKLKVRCPGLSCRALEFSAPTSFPLHLHAAPSVIFVYEGEWTEDDGAGTRHLRRGDVLFHPAGAEHQTAARAGTVIVLMEISRTLLARADDASAAVIYSLVLQMLAIGSRAPIEANPQTPEWMPRLIAYINANLAERLTLSRLADLAAVSQSHLSQSFARYFRSSVSDYIRDCRLRAAARALRRTNETIEKIACDTGFSDHAHSAARVADLPKIPPSDHLIFPPLETTSERRIPCKTRSEPTSCRRRQAASWRESWSMRGWQRRSGGCTPAGWGRSGSRVRWDWTSRRCGSG